MTFIKRLLIILILLNLLGPFHGCNNFQQQIILFDLNKMDISTIDNSGLYPQQTESDSMFSEAVAFRIEVSDSSGMIGLAAIKPYFFGISSCRANEPEPSFQPAQLIESITIITLYDITNDLPANTDVTANFCYGYENYSVPGDLYLTWDQLIELLSNWSYDYTMLSFDLFLKEKVMAETSQFVVSLELSDGRTLQDTTALISIINEDE